MIRVPHFTQEVRRLKALQEGPSRGVARHGRWRFLHADGHELSPTPGYNAACPLCAAVLEGSGVEVRVAELEVRLNRALGPRDGAYPGCRF